MSRELECVYEEMIRAEAQLALAWKLLLQYHAEIASRSDLMAEGFCQGAWFIKNYDELERSMRTDTMPEPPYLDYDLAPPPRSDQP